MKYKIILSVLALVVAAESAILLKDHFSRSEYAFVEISALYKDFALKKDLDKQFEAIVSSKKNVLDSIELELNVISEKLKTMKENAPGFKESYKEFDLKRQEYYLRMESFEKEKEQVGQQFTDQVFARLNEFIKQYGEEEQYKYIFGADGSGSLMFADKGEDITADVKEYINEKYSGK
jgi:outer membrane protein